MNGMEQLRMAGAGSRLQTPSITTTESGLVKNSDFLVKTIFRS
jgi:hypothetical protein